MKDGRVKHPIWFTSRSLTCDLAAGEFHSLNSTFRSSSFTCHSRPISASSVLFEIQPLPFRPILSCLATTATTHKLPLVPRSPELNDTLLPIFAMNFFSYILLISCLPFTWSAIVLNTLVENHDINISNSTPYMDASPQILARNQTDNETLAVSFITYHIFCSPKSIHRQLPKLRHGNSCGRLECDAVHKRRMLLRSAWCSHLW